MNYKILVTGENRRAAAEIESTLPESYAVKKCSVSNYELSCALKSFNPGVVVICLGGDSVEMMLYNHMLCETPEYKNTQIIIVGSIEVISKMKSFAKREDIVYVYAPYKIEDIIENIKSLYEIIEELEREEQERQNALNSHTEVFDNEDKKLILVIDDDIRTLKNIKNLLSGVYQVAVATCGSVAIKFLEKHKCDIILLDYVMPEEDGPEVLRKIRKMPDLVDVPVIFLTGVKDSDMIKKCLSLKPQGYLLKPVNSTVLHKRIEELLE